MIIRHRWLGAITASLLVGAVGCGNDKASGGDDKNNTPDSGTIDETPDGGLTMTMDGGDNAAPDFNYIPANEGKCDVQTKPELRAAATTTLSQLVSYPTKVAHEFELCAKSAEDRLCAPCAENKFIDWLNAVDAADTGGAAGKDGRMTLVDYFRRALQYPLRDLLVIDTEEATERRLILAQGKMAATCTDSTTCRSFLLQHESMEDNCTTITQSIEALSATTAGDGTETVVSKTSNHAFSFYVPLVSELPTFPLANPPTIPDTSPRTCPTAAEVASEADFKSFLLCNPNLRVSLTTPHIKQTKSVTGTQCLQLEGLVSVTDLPEAARNLVDTTVYEDLDAPGFIRVTLAARLFESTAEVDPSLIGEVVP